MPSSSVRTFTDPDTYHAAIRAQQVEGVVTARGNFCSELTRVDFDRLQMQGADENLARVLNVTTTRERVGVFLSLAGGDPVDARGAHRHHQAVMRRLEEVLQASSGEPLYMTVLCRAAGASYRTLRDCCQEHLGMSPKRYLCVRRMQLARRALRRADAETTTVTAIATNYGFWELGRFAVAYLSLFGESPSIALRRPPDNAKPGESVASPWQFAKSA